MIRMGSKEAWLIQGRKTWSKQYSATETANGRTWPWISRSFHSNRSDFSLKKVHQSSSNSQLPWQEKPRWWRQWWSRFATKKHGAVTFGPYLRAPIFGPINHVGLFVPLCPLCPLCPLLRLVGPPHWGQFLHLSLLKTLLLIAFCCNFWCWIHLFFVLLIYSKYDFSISWLCPPSLFFRLHSTRTSQTASPAELVRCAS